MFLAETLFVMHADIIAEQFGSDIAAPETTPNEREFLARKQLELQEAMRTSVATSNSFPSLGFDPDYLMHGKDALLARWAGGFANERDYVGLLRHSFWRAVLHQPAEFSAKVMSQLSLFYGRQCPALHKRDAAADGALLANAEDAQGARRLADAVSLRGCVLFALVILLRGGISRSQQLAAFLVLFLSSMNFCNTLGISVVHTMEIDRYATVQFAAALLAECWALRWLVTTLQRALQRFSIKARGAGNEGSARDGK